MQKIDLTPFREYLISRIRKGVLNGQKLFLEIHDQGYQGSYETLYRYLRNELNNYWIKPYKKSYFYHKKTAINLSKYKSATRYETGLGEQALVDWGHFKTVILNGKRKKLYCFVFVLGYSRASYIEFTTSENLSVFESCHINAFKVLGIPKSIIYDNTKTVVLSNHKIPGGGRKINLNLNFFDFARFYGFEIIASHPYWPRDKGKVEAGVKYVRNNFMQGVKFTKSLTSLEEFNKIAHRWIDQIANNRIHGTTEEKPRDRWLREKLYLRSPNGLPDYPISPIIIRFSTKDQFIQYKQNFYSVPKAYSWRKLFIREVHLQGNKLINIYFQNELIAQHNLSTERGKSIANPLHFPKSPKNNSQELFNNHSWKNYPDIPVRPFEFYDQVIIKN